MLRTENIKMAERISAAVYFLTNFFNEEEPLKWELRKMSLKLIEDSFKDKNSVLKSLSHLLSLAKKVGLVSDINYDILHKEILNLDQEYRLLSPFDIQSDEYVRKPSVVNIKDRLGEGVTKKTSLISNKKNTRQGTILDIIRRKKEVMIKDISVIVEGYSDKTLQRELLGMVKDGILKKTGEKRWSRYSIVES